MSHGRGLLSLVSGEVVFCKQLIMIIKGIECLVLPSGVEKHKELSTKFSIF
jgi:hypothetical protein